MEKNIKEKQELCEKIWNECKDELTKLCRYKLQSCPDEIDDVVADTFFYLCKAIFGEEELFNYKAWMLAVTNNLNECRSLNKPLSISTSFTQVL